MDGDMPQNGAAADPGMRRRRPMMAGLGQSPRRFSPYGQQVQAGLPVMAVQPRRQQAAGLPSMGMAGGGGNSAPPLQPFGSGGGFSFVPQKPPAPDYGMSSNPYGLNIPEIERDELNRRMQQVWRWNQHFNDGK